MQFEAANVPVFGLGFGLGLGFGFGTGAGFGDGFGDGGFGLRPLSAEKQNSIWLVSALPGVDGPSALCCPV